MSTTLRLHRRGHPRSPRSLFTVVAAAALAALAACVSSGAASGGREAAAAAAAAASRAASASALVARMRDRYAGQWFHTLTFVQRTKFLRPGGVRDSATWLEALQAPSRLRIDIEPRASGNGILFTADSTYRIRDGRVAAATADANPLMPFVAALYLQPVERTMLELSREHYDTTRLRTDTWEGQPVIVVGADRDDDLTSPQFWVDAARLVLVRMLLPPPPTRPDGKTVDIRMGGYRPFGPHGALVATRVDVIAGADTVQSEEYLDVHVDVPLDPALFDPASWTTARHWKDR